MVKVAFKRAAAKSNTRSQINKASKVLAKRYKNKPVASKMKKPRARATVDKRQTSAIMTLSKQVRSLQLMQYGDTQYQYQFIKLRPSVDLSYSQQLPSMQHPVFFAANSFYLNTPVYRAEVNPAGYSQFPQLVDYDNGGIPMIFQKQEFNVNLDDRYQWNQVNNLNTVSKVEYLPISMKYKFRFLGKIAHNKGLQTPIRYRITLFTTKATPVSNSIKDYILPSAAAGYRFLCVDDPENRQHFHKGYHKIISDRFVTFTPPTDPSSVAQINTLVEMQHAFPAKLLKPNIQKLPVDISNQRFWTNIAPEDTIWCMISSNLDNENWKIAPQINVQRTLVWRDKHDATAGDYGSNI